MPLQSQDLCTQLRVLHIQLLQLLPLQLLFSLQSSILQEAISYEKSQSQNLLQMTLDLQLLKDSDLQNGCLLTLINIAVNIPYLHPSVKN